MSKKNHNNRNLKKGNQYPLQRDPHQTVFVSCRKGIPQPVPEIGKTYVAYDDGKIRPSRASKVKVVDLYGYMYVKKNLHDLFNHWIEEKKSCYWLYADTTDYFVKTVNENGEDEYFVRTKGRGWFSIGELGSGRLDADGHLTRDVIRDLNDSNYTYDKKETEEIIDYLENYVL